MLYDQLKLDNQLCFRLYAASRLMIQTYRPYLEQLNVTYPQYLVLMVLWETNGMPVNDIAKKLALETNTATPLIQRMERDGLVSRSKGKVDTRQTIVTLTEKGEKLKEAAADIPNCMLDILAKNGVSTETLSGLSPLLDDIVAHLRKD